MVMSSELQGVHLRLVLWGQACMDWKPIAGSWRGSMSSALRKLVALVLAACCMEASSARVSIPTDVIGFCRIGGVPFARGASSTVATEGVGADVGVCDEECVLCPPPETPAPPLDGGVPSATVGSGGARRELMSIFGTISLDGSPQRRKYVARAAWKLFHHGCRQRHRSLRGIQLCGNRQDEQVP